MSTHGGGSRQRGGGGNYPPTSGNAGYGRTVTYTSEPTRASLTQTFGRPLTEHEIANLAGAEPGSHVEVGKYGMITATAPDGQVHTIRIPQPAAGAPLTLVNFQFADAHGDMSMPFPAETLVTQVRQAQALGMNIIHQKSRAGSRDYMELPHLGYDAPVDASLLGDSRGGVLNRPPVRGQYLSDVLAQPAGYAWWDATGLNPTLYFDLTPGSRSIQTLNSYLQAQGMPPV